MARNTRSDAGKPRVLTQQEMAIEAALDAVTDAQHALDRAQRKLILANTVSPKTDNRRRVLKRAKKARART
jgi:hypothetical protein